MQAILTVIGTRPEAIKMAPVLLAMRAAAGIRSLLCVTGQHRHMLDGALAEFGLVADFDLDIMRPGQDLTWITSAVLEGLRPILADTRPDWLLVHGDTTTAMAAAMAGFYAGVPIAHVEAGLRSHDLGRPFPEEMNRVVVDRMASLFFAPTAGARRNLLRERVEPGRIVVTGNTAVDAVLAMRGRILADPAWGGWQRGWRRRCQRWRRGGALFWSRAIGERISARRLRRFARPCGGWRRGAMWRWSIPSISTRRCASRRGTCWPACRISICCRRGAMPPSPIC